MFRGVHSVKGGAGIFGFEQLVGFAHVFETVLDGLRNGSLTATPENLDVLLSASDVLTDLVSMSRSGQAAPPALAAIAVPRLNRSSRKAVAAAKMVTSRRLRNSRDSISCPSALTMDAPAERRRPPYLLRLLSGLSRKC